MYVYVYTIYIYIYTLFYTHRSTFIYVIYRYTYMCLLSLLNAFFISLFNREGSHEGARVWFMWGMVLGLWVLGSFALMLEGFGGQGRCGFWTKAFMSKMSD